MERKPIKLSPKRGGNGYVSSYSVNIGIREAEVCGFICPDGPVELEKIIDPENHRIIFQLKAGE